MVVAGRTAATLQETVVKARADGGTAYAAALDHGLDNIRAIAAGLVDTPFVATGRPPQVMAARIAAHPIGRICRRDEIADAVVWLCSDQSSFVTGAALPAGGGYTAQ